MKCQQMNVFGLSLVNQGYAWHITPFNQETKTFSRCTSTPQLQDLLIQLVGPLHMMDICQNLSLVKLSRQDCVSMLALPSR